MRKCVDVPEYHKNNFIQKSIKRHGDIYDYSEVVYINSIQKVKIICKEHGEFFVRPDAHVRKVGCPTCKGGVKYDTDKFILLAKSIHYDRFDYSKVNYINSTKKVEIICKEHGSFFISPANHLLGQSCSICSGVKKKSLEDFISISNLAHDSIYSYDKVEYKNNRKKVIITCKEHGDFEQIPKDHMRGSGCKLCNYSKGEKEIEKKLKYLGINFLREYSFESCVGIGGRKLPFDFFIEKFNILIEYDGIQHFKPVHIFGGEKSFVDLKKNDEIRNRWCQENGFNLIRVKYDSNIGSLENELKLLLKIS